MKLEAVPSAAKAYQGSVSKAAGVSALPKKASKASSVSGTAKAPDAVSVSGDVNIFRGRQAEASSLQKAEDGRVVMREPEPDTSDRALLYEDDSDADIPENTGMQQSGRQIEEAVEKLKAKLDVNTEAVFGIHEGTNRVMIKIIDKSTRDVIKEFPPEKTLDMIQKVWEMAGIMVDEKL